MKPFLLIFLLALLNWSCNRKVSDHYQLVWSDDFEYNGLPDSAKWSYDNVGNSWGWGNRELQYYTVTKIENAEVSNGTLKIKALKQKLKNCNYTSARLITKYKGDWLYGKFEIRAKLPDGRGLWPAIWMLPTDWEYGGWPQSGEIDIMENVGFDPDTIVCSVHTTNYNHKMKTQHNNRVALPDNRKEFHIYGLEWTEEYITTTIDGRACFTFPKESDDPAVWPFNRRFHLLLNLAVGGDWGGALGIDDTAFPATMEIDYVRVYQKKTRH